MIAIIRAAVMGFVLLTVVYVAVSIYSRSVRREKLERAWDTDPAREGAVKDERDAYIETGMETYRHGLRRKLIWLVYVIPMAVVLATVYYVDYQ